MRRARVASSRAGRARPRRRPGRCRGPCSTRRSRGTRSAARDPATLSRFALLFVVGALATPRDVRGATELLVDPTDALDLALRGEALEEAFAAERAGHLGPRCEPACPPLHAVFLRLGSVRREVRAHPEHRLPRDGPGRHVALVAPRLAPRLLGGAQEVAHHLVILFGLARQVLLLAELLPLRRRPLVELVEQLGLE